MRVHKAPGQILFDQAQQRQALLHGNRRRLHRVQGDQPPQAPQHAHGQGGRGAHPHIAQVFDVQRRHAAQAGVGQVHAVLAQAVHGALAAAGIEDKAQRVVDVQLARDARDIRRGEAQALIAVEAAIAQFRHDFPATVVQKPVQHDLGIAGQRVDAAQQGVDTQFLVQGFGVALDRRAQRLRMR